MPAAVPSRKMEFLRMVSEPSRSQWLPASGREISISLLSLANISQYLSGIIEAALHGMAAETAVGLHRPTAELRRTLPNASVHHGNDIRALPRRQSRNIALCLICNRWITQGIDEHTDDQETGAWLPLSKAALNPSARTECGTSRFRD